jgi:hypothetical protein
MRHCNIARELSCWLVLSGLLSQCSWSAPPQLSGRLPIIDTLEVLLQGSHAGTLVASLSQRADTTENSIVLSVDMSDQSGTASQHLQLEEQRRYDSSGALVSARQRMSADAGVNEWTLTAAASGRTGRLSVIAAGETTSRDIGPLHEHIGALKALYAGILSNSLHAGERWTDTAVELTSGESVVTETTCEEVPSNRNDNCWVFACTNNLLQRREIWKLDCRGKTVYRDMYPYTCLKNRGNGAVTGENNSNVSLFDMMKVAAARPADVARELISVSFDNKQAVDSSVARFFRRRNASYVLLPLPRQCTAGEGSLSAAETAALLAPTATLQSGHPKIRRLADSLRASGKSSASPCELVGRYNHWVYSALRKKTSPTFSSALETLEAGYGDCGEHAVLLAALLRSPGIPARVVAGLLYVVADKGYYYHAWVMAYTGSWIFADPSHDCFPAWRDRIPLVLDDDGTKLTALARVIGRTSVAYVKR